jgi:hypothetical protein
LYEKLIDDVEFVILKYLLLELSFANRAIRMVCEDEDDAKAKFGLAVATELQSRLADLDAALSIKDLLAGRPKEINDTISFQVQLSDGYKLIFSANHVTNPQKDGKIDWELVRRIKITEIENNYE